MSPYWDFQHSRCLLFTVAYVVGVDRHRPKALADVDQLRGVDR